MMKIRTTRFGELEIDEKRVIHFQEGLLGFPEQNNYVIMEHKTDSPFCWLQSVDIPELAFVIINPFLIKNDYLEDLPPDEKALFSTENNNDKVVFALVTIPTGQPEKITANLLGPLVIETRSRTGRQVILANSGYNTHHPLVAD